jgi:large subunit ribosomal protein L25
MATILLAGQRRTLVGTGGARKVRGAGMIPGVLYGPHEEPTSLQVPYKDLEGILRSASGENAIIDLRLDGGGEGLLALIRDVQRDPVRRRILHVDFQHISMTQRIRVRVPVHLTGVPHGVKDFGGILEPILREVEVECLPADIPSHVSVDVTAMEIGDAVHVRDIQQEGVEILDNADQVVATVVPPTVEKAPVVEAVPEGEEPEIIAKGKEEGEAGGEEATKKGGAEGGKKPAEAAKKPGEGAKKG